MRLLLLMAAACLLAGCTASHWESAYVGSRVPRANKEPVRVWTVAWERIDATLGELEKETASSDIPPTDWPPERVAEAHAKLIRGLQVPADPRTIEVLGRSDFATTDTVKPNTQSGRAELEELAEKVGADTVVWSSHSLGMADRIVDRPVINNRSGSYGGDPAMRATYSETETMWVPVVVKTERKAYIAFFLRYTPEKAPE